MDDPGKPLLRRPNGRPQACDPCRIRKVACDHGQPVCRRCIKRRHEERCKYTITAPTPGSSLSVTARRHPPYQRTNALLPTGPPSTPPTLLPSPDSDLPGPGPSGYLGFTSHSAVFEETDQSLRLLHGSSSEPPVSQPTPSTPRTTRLRDSLRSPPLREMSLCVLRTLAHPGVDGIGISCAGPRRADTWIHIAVSRILESLRRLFKAYDLYPGDEDKGTNTDARLETIAETISVNTAAPFRNDLVDPQEWLAQFAGPSLRWESLGLLWGFWAIGTGPLDQAGTSTSDWFSGGAEQLQVCRVSLDYCIRLARAFCESHDLLLYLCFRRTVLESVLCGDAALSCWTSHGDTVSLMTFLGLHDDPGSEAYKPTLCSELKRRVFGYIFNSDKISVSFTGRPPLISRRYSSTPLPLDLCDKDLLADEETIARAVAELDGQGWNTKGKLYPTTFIRARVMLAFIRDEVIEIALAPRPNATIDNLLNIKTRVRQTVSSFPETLIYDPQHLSDLSITAPTLYARLIIRLESLQTDFFVDRLMLRLGRPDDGDLLVTSFDMVSLTLIFWTQKDRFAGMIRCFEWLVMSYAAPGGGILCLELLRPTFQGQHPRNPKLTRSNIVQQLSLLVGFLDWVRPSAPNGDLCARSKAIIQRVLDHTLNTTTAGGGPAEELDWGFFDQPDFNFGLLDTFDWLPSES